jgi:hypothetical protein
MKITDVIKQLTALKKLHGNLPVTLINGNTGYTQDVLSVDTIHPYNGLGGLDRTKPAYAVVMHVWKA